MCFTVPGKIIKIEGNIATVDYDGIERNADISMIKAELGDYVIINAGFAVEKIENKSAKDFLEMMSSG